MWPSVAKSCLIALSTRQRRQASTLRLPPRYSLVVHTIWGASFPPPARGTCIEGSWKTTFLRKRIRHDFFDLSTFNCVSDVVPAPASSVALTQNTYTGMKTCRPILCYRLLWPPTMQSIGDLEILPYSLWQLEKTKEGRNTILLLH